MSSPVMAAQARRKVQYKATAGQSGSREPAKVSMRDRFKARCVERAVREREKAVKGKRYGHAPSDDDAMEDDGSEDEEMIMGDEASAENASPLVRG